MMTQWIFAYGSLLWDPGFAPAETQRATLAGYQRSFCMWSVHYRGTPHSPGLVLALEPRPGARCQGLALRVPAPQAGAVLADLRARELVSNAYEERQLPLTLEDGRQVAALSYVIRPGHAQHCALDRAEQARIIAQAAGTRGPNRDYLANTHAQLRRLGLEDPDIAWLAAQVEAKAQ